MTEEERLKEAMKAIKDALETYKVHFCVDGWETFEAYLVCDDEDNLKGTLH